MLNVVSIKHALISVCTSITHIVCLIYSFCLSRLLLRFAYSFAPYSVEKTYLILLTYFIERSASNKNQKFKTLFTWTVHYIHYIPLSVCVPICLLWSRFVQHYTFPFTNNILKAFLNITKSFVNRLIFVFRSTGFTHLVCESICISVHRSLSPSHPVFRLMAPHFLYLIAINRYCTLFFFGIKLFKQTCFSYLV